jgi:3-demethoxyubiquinol 3-hydroxylase
MKTGDVRNPGDPEPRELIERTIRVDQAGEFGAVRIYEGQLAALRWTGRANSDAGRKIAAMARAEREHNQVFDRLLVERRVRPTALQPLWSVAGFALGAATALMGDKAAMACTVAVEETIDEHYAHQAAALGDDEAELRSTIEKFRAEEIEHKDTALGAGAGLRGADGRHQGGLAIGDLAVDPLLAAHHADFDVACRDAAVALKALLALGLSETRNGVVVRTSRHMEPSTERQKSRKRNWPGHNQRA